jgi:phage terminase small subunit
MVDGQLISEVKKGRDGASIKLMDKMKALEKLEKYLDVIPDRWKRQIEEEKLKIAKMRAPGAELLNNVNIIVELKGDAE